MQRREESFAAVFYIRRVVFCLAENVRKPIYFLGYSLFFEKLAVGVKAVQMLLADICKL